MRFRFGSDTIFCYKVLLGKVGRRRKLKEKKNGEGGKGANLLFLEVCVYFNFLVKLFAPELCRV